MICSVIYGFFWSDLGSLGVLPRIWCNAHNQSGLIPDLSILSFLCLQSHAFDRNTIYPTHYNPKPHT